jgi:hypothetical protein
MARYRSILAILALGLTACGGVTVAAIGTAAAVPSQAVASQAVASQAAPSQAAPSQAAPSPGPSQAAPSPGPSQAVPSPGPSQALPIVLTSGPLTVTLTALADETVIDTPQVDVVGQAPADTVITINDTIVVVEASGQFSVSVPLQVGPNELDVIASDPAGNQASSKLIVTYEPPD